MVRPLKALIVSSTKPEFVERVGVDHHLDVMVVGDGEAAVDRRGRRAPVLMQFERAGAGLDLLDQRRRLGRIALAGEAEVHRIGVGRLDHALDVPGAGRAGGGEGAGRGPRAAAQHRGDAGHERLLDLLRADEMDVRVEAAGGEDLAFARDHFGAGTDNDGDAGLDVGIAGLADRGDEAILQADVGFDDAPMVEDEGVGDDGIDGAARVGRLRLPHAVADHLAAAELHLFAVSGEILLDLDDELRVGEADPVAGRGAEHFGVMGAGQGGRGEGVTGGGHLTNLSRARSGEGWNGSKGAGFDAIEGRGGGAAESRLISARK